MTSLVEGLKCAKTSLEMTFSQSKDPVVKNTGPMVKIGKKWNPQEVVNMHEVLMSLGRYEMSLGRYRVEVQGLG